MNFAKFRNHLIYYEIFLLPQADRITGYTCNVQIVCSRMDGPFMDGGWKSCHVKCESPQECRVWFCFGLAHTWHKLRSISVAMVRHLGYPDSGLVVGQLMVIKSPIGLAFPQTAGLRILIHADQSVYCHVMHVSFEDITFEKLLAIY